MSQHPKAKAAGITPDLWYIQEEEVSPRCITPEVRVVVTEGWDVVCPYKGIRNEADANLIADAGNTMNAHGHTPSEMVGVIRELAKERDRYKGAIENCLNWANGHECEWGERAEDAFEFLDVAMSIIPTKTEDFR